MGVIVDSGFWIALASGDIDNQAVIEAAGNGEVYISIISLGELSFGVESCAEPENRAQRSAFLRQIERRPTLHVSRQTAAAFGVLAAAVKQSGRSPRARYNDLWIAAQAIEHGHMLLTLNTNDFAGLPGLRLAIIPFSARAD